MDEYHRNLRLRIIERFWTQEKFSKEAGIDEALVSKIIRRIRKPTDEQKEVFSRLLEASETELFPSEKEN